jgi:purine-nucleoside phosphorylase
VVSVGDPSRAAVLASFFDNSEQTKVVSTNRGFTTYTGTFRSVPVTVVATGMGMAMADFMMREVKCNHVNLMFILVMFYSSNSIMLVFDVVVSNHVVIVVFNHVIFDVCLIMLICYAVVVDHLNL